MVEAGGESVRTRSALEATVVGSSLSVALPGRLGELAQPALLAIRERVSLALTMGSFATTRIFDVLTVVAGFGIGLLLGPPSARIDAWPEIWRRLSYLSPLLAAGVLATLVLSSRWYLELRQKAGPKRLRETRLGKHLDLMALGLRGLAQPKILFGSLADSLLCWLLILAATWIGLESCNVDLPAGAVLVLMPLLVLGIAVPTPAGAGGYHAAMTFGLAELYSVDKTVAASASLLVHLVMTVPIVALAFLIYMRESDPLPSMDQVLDATRPIQESDPDSGQQER